MFRSLSFLGSIVVNSHTRKKCPNAGLVLDFFTLSLTAAGFVDQHAVYLYSNSTNSFQLRINAALGILISESGFVISWVFKFGFTGGEVSLNCKWHIGCGLDGGGVWSLGHVDVSLVYTLHTLNVRADLPSSVDYINGRMAQMPKHLHTYVYKRSHCLDGKAPAYIITSMVARLRWKSACLGTMAAKWLNSVDVDFVVQFPRLSMRAVQGFVRSLKVEPQDLLGLVAILDTRNQVARITFTTEAYTSSFLSQHSGIVRTELEGKEVDVVIRDSNIQEKFVRIAGIPQNLDLGVVKTRLKEFGTIIDACWERYRVAEDDVLYPFLATWMIVRMTLTKNIPSYITIGSYRAMGKYEGQKPTCRLCDDETHFSYNCPTLRRNKEPTNVQKPSDKMTKKTETVLEKPVPLPLDVDPMVSKAFLECGLQSSLSGGTPNLEISPTEQPVKSTDDILR
ncbi:hypothetical protein OUZ56_033342 [Daphnia magna]|uniref:CCHC-type domain-containing protein n=1 Tax=Daphnia magna TaxID=35525 RepID=A0ABQ9ZXM3_9CRUS|nr:hypothetical protein OUZ56_033342 [Daphnia magna]